MNDRRGHRKLRLTSRKHFKPKLKRSHGNVSTKKSELQPDFTISVPLEQYVDAPVKSIGSLQSRIQSCQTIPSGM